MVSVPTAAGLNLIKQYEGFRADAYADPLSGWVTPTIGYGTTVYAGGGKVKPGDTITEPKALEELKHHVLKTVTPALAQLPFYAEMTEPMIGALESFAYNLGAHFYGAKGFETISRRLQNKEWDKMRSALMLYVNPGSAVEVGLRRRRTAEADLWELGLKQVIKTPDKAPQQAVNTQSVTIKAGQLSKNFTLAELTVTNQRFNNTPGPAEMANLIRLAQTCLQPLRDKTGKPVIITSGFRSSQVNVAVGGSRTSAHLTGCAADLHVPGFTISELFKLIHALKLPVDQVIDEFGRWIHLGIAKPGVTPRHQYLLARSVNGRTVYTVAKL